VEQFDVEAALRRQLVMWNRHDNAMLTPTERQVRLHQD